MCDLPGPGLEPVSLALAGRFLTTAPPGKLQNITFIFDIFIGCKSLVWQLIFSRILTVLSHYLLASISSPGKSVISLIVIPLMVVFLLFFWLVLRFSSSSFVFSSCTVLYLYLSCLSFRVFLESRI